MITKCEICNHLERLFLESIIDADKAETALRCYLITHQWSAGVSDMDEYNALRESNSGRRTNVIEPTRIW